MDLSPLEQLKKKLKKTLDNINPLGDTNPVQAGRQNVWTNTARSFQQPVVPKVRIKPQGGTIEQASSAIQAVPKIRLSSKTSTLGEATQNAWKNNLFQTMARANTRTPVDQVVRPAGQMASGVFSGISLGMANPVTQKPRNVIEQGANIAGNVAGAFSPVGLGAKVLSPVGRIAENSIRLKLASKAAPILINKVAPAVGSELAQTATLTAGHSALGQDFNPVEDFATGIGLRGAGKTIGRSVRVFRKPDSQDAAILDQATEVLRSKSPDAKDLVRATRDIDNLLEGYLRERMPKAKYGALKKASTFKQIAELQKYLKSADKPAPRIESGTYQMGFAAKNQTIGDLQRKTQIPELTDYEKAINSGDFANAEKISLKFPGDARSQIHKRFQTSIKDQLNKPPDRARMSLKAQQEGITTPRTGRDISVSPQARIRFKGQVTTPASGSVVESIKSGFEKGRIAHDEAQKAAKGSFGLRARTQFIDRLSPVHDLVKQAGKDLPAEQNPYKKMRLLAGVSGKVEAYLDNNVAPILQKEKDRIDDLSTLWTLERERELVGMKGLARKRSMEDIQRGFEELRVKYGDEGFRTLQESSNELRTVGNELLDELHDAGIIDNATFNTIRSTNQFYAPMEAVEHIADNLEKGHGTGSFNVASQDAVKRIGDYMGDVSDPLETLVRRIPKIMALAEKNKAMQSLVGLRKQYPELYKNVIVPFQGDPPPGMGIVNVFEDGKNVRYAVPDVIEGAIKNLDAQQGNILVNLTKWQANMLRAGATALNIGFIPVNTVRDIQDAVTTEISEKGIKAALTMVASYPRAIFAAAKRDDLYKDWLASGGAQSTWLEQINENTPKSVAELSGQKNVIKSVISSPKSAVEFLNRVAEQSTRIARFSAGRARGESIAEAGFKSRDISLDFAKAGNTVKLLNQVVPFLNAGIQGSEKLLRLYKSNPVEASIFTGILYSLPTLQLYAHNSQFADYGDIPESEKQNHWIIIARDRTPEELDAGEDIVGIKIPKGFLGRMVANTLESSLDFMQKQDPQAFASSLMDSLEGISPVGLPRDEESLGRTIAKVTPPGARAAYEWISNKNTHFGTPIVPQGLEDVAPSEQYKESTPSIYKNVGAVTGISPLKLENTVNTTTGGVGRQVATLLSGDLEGASVGQVTRRFSGVRGGAETEKAWDTVEQEKQYTATRNKQIKDAIVEGNQEEFDRLTEGMSRKQIKQLMNSVEDKAERSQLSPEQRAYETLTKEERKRLGAERPELKTELELLEKADASSKTGLKINVKGEEDTIEWDDDEGDTVSVTLSSKDYSNKTGIAAFQQDNDNAAKARKLFGAPSDQVSDKVKEAAYKKLGLEKEDVEYDYKANFENDVKTRYILSQNLEPEELRERLLTGRVKSISGKYFITEGVLKDLHEQGIITKAEQKYFNSLKLDKELNPIAGSGSGSGRGKKVNPDTPPKLKFAQVSAPAKMPEVRFTKQASRIKLAAPRKREAPTKVKLKTLSKKNIKLKSSYYQQA